MIALACFFAAGVVTFSEQPLPGLETGSRVFPAALATVNTRAADIDEDGLIDLVLPSGVWLRKGDLYPKAGAIALPDRRHFEVVYAENGRLYGCGTGEVACFSLYAQRWRNEWTVSLPSIHSPASTIQPLFHDVDGDGHAELVAPWYDTLLVHNLSDSAQLIAELDVYPPVRPRLESTNNLWTSRSSPPTGAIATRDFRIAFDGPSLTTRETIQAGDRRVEYRFVSYTLARNPDGLFSYPVSESWASAALPDVMLPYRSSRDGAIAFAGARPANVGPARLEDPLTEVLLASRSNPSPQIVRTKAPLAFLALADFDGDGDEDLLTQSNTLMSGPPREVLMRLASAHTVRHTFSVHVQDNDGRFNPRPRHTQSIDIDLDGPAIDDGPRWQAYRQGALTCASADFNADRRADIAAWFAPRRLGVWINQEGVFNKEPDAVLSISDGGGLALADVDRDGRADLVILPAPGTAAPPTVWFSR